MKEVCSIYNSPFGLLTIANDGYYITNVLYGNHSDKFTFEQNNPINAKVMEELQEYFEGKRQTFDLPLNFNGTKFQNKVWNAILKIPYGATRSCSEIAEDIGKPTSVRAIGNANAKNPIAILIPCHRVVNSNGTLAGYIGGIFNKKKLLDLEKSTISKINQKLVIENNVSSKLLKMALESTDICNFYHYPQEEVSIVPEKTCIKFGMKPRYENNIQEFVDEKIFIDDREIFKQSFNRIKYGETPIKFETRFTNGFWTRYTLSIAQYDENNLPLIVVGIIEDITEQKTLEVEKNKLTNLNKEVLSALNEVFLGVHKLNLITGKIYSIRLVNGVSEFKLNSDYNFNEWVRTFSKEYYHPCDRNKLLAIFSLENIIKQRDNGVTLIEEKYRRLIGNSYHYISNNIIINNKNFDRNVAIIYQMDVSQWYEQSNILQDLCNDYYAIYLININQDTYETIRFDKVVKNEINIQKRGTYQEIAKNYIQKLIHEKDKPTITEFMSLKNLRKSLNKQNNEISKIFRKKVGFHYEWVEMKFTLTSMERNPIVILSMKNVNEDIKHEFETKQILEIAFTQTKNSSQAKSNFLSKVSKDIKTPITAIMGYTTLAKNSIENPEKLKEYLENISHNNNKLLSLVNNSLDFKSIENNNYNIENKTFKFSNFIQYVLEIIMPNVEKNHINFNYHIENVIHENLIGDVEKINPMLVNVLNNAIIYTQKDGNVDFTIKELSIPSNDVNDEIHYQFIIKDNGIGIKKDELNSIFDSFFRGSNVGNISGSGLGLTTAVSIAKLLKGDINVESELNQGTTVTINLMLRLAEDEKISIPNFYHAKVLVVNSNPNELTYIGNMLKDFKLDFKSILFGKYVIDELCTAHSNYDDYSIIMIDENLADMDYLSLIQNINDNFGFEPIKIIVTTFNYALAQADCINKKVDMILPKPLFKQETMKSFIQITDTLRKCFIENPIKSKILQGYNCLLIEHNPNTQLLALELVSLLGANVTVAKNTEEALEFFYKNSNSLDFITIDIDMPNLDGFKIAESMRNINNNIPIIAMSHNCSPEDVPNCIKKGFSFHIIKPVDNNLNFFVYVIYSNVTRYHKFPTPILH